jgi:RecB family endonuclease NucS
LASELARRNPFFVYKNPTFLASLSVTKKAISERKTLILVGNCWVNYRGRASSKLGPGERILMIKKDGSVLVHRSKGYEPVNWQPPGCFFQTYMEKNSFVVKAIRHKPHEVIKIHFDRIYLLSILDLTDEGVFSLHASESDMQKAIVLMPSIIEKGLKVITYEKKTDPGFIDVYGVDGNGNLVVIEIKRKTAGKNAVLQLAKYVNYLKKKSNRIRGILVAPDISKGVQRLLGNLNLQFKPLDPKKCREIIDEIETKKLMDFF